MTVSMIEVVCGRMVADAITDYAAVAISVAAVLFSLMGLAYQLRSSESIGYAQMLLDIDKALIEEPRLWQVYDVRQAEGPDALDRGRLEAFVYMHLNIFYMLYQGHVRRLWLCRNQWEAEQCFMMHFFKESSLAREIAGRQSTKDVYPAAFTAFIGKMMRQAKDGTCGGASADGNL